MIFKKIAVLTSKDSWFLPYAKNFVKSLQKKKIKSKLFSNHVNISKDYSVIFILSYFKIIEKKFLCDHKYNLVVHESSLPKGKGWSPLFWQILEGKNKIPVVLFDATEKADEGHIYIKDYINLEGHELHDEIRQKQAMKTIELCQKFLNKHQALRSQKQRGKSTYYKKRSPIDSRLDINKSIKEQFNLFRIVNNKDFPAFFEYKGYRYIIKISKA